MIWWKPSLFSSAFADRGAGVQRDIAYGDHPRLKLDVYRPAPGVVERDAVILFLYGGSWSSGDKSIYPFVGHALASRGFTTVIPDYRLYPEVQFPAFFEDAALAYAWVDRNLAKACTPARPIILAGHSAGAHMAALLAVDPTYIARAAPDAAKPAALIGLAGPYNFYPTKWPSTKAAFASIKDQPDLPRPIAHVGTGAPPALLLYGLADDVVELKNLRVMTDALRVAGNSVETAEYKGVGHIGILLALSRPLRWRAPVLDDVVKFASKIGSPTTCAVPHAN